MNSTERKIAVAIHFGTTATWKRASKTFTRSDDYPMVQVQVCAAVEDGAYSPASSVTVCGRDALLALRYAIDEALKDCGAAAN